MSRAGGCIVYVLGAFPAPSQTFVAREIRTLLRLGLPLRVFALGREESTAMPDEDRAWAAAVRHLPNGFSWPLLAAHAAFLRDPALRRRYLGSLGALVRLRHRPPYLVLRALYVFWRVVPLAWELLGEEVRHVHAHFAVSQTEAALGLARLLGCGYSFTAHARDIYASPNALEEKLRGARFVVTCTDYNAAHLRRVAPDLPEGRLHTVRHGVDLPPVHPAGGSQPPILPAETEGPLLLSAGRLIPKKGLDVLVDACALLRDRGVLVRCAIAGEGPLRRKLARRIERAGLHERVHLLGWLSPAELARLYREATAFALPCRVVTGGDRDGLPNVIVEALSHGVPVVSTRVSAVPELVEHGVSGLLVAPDDPRALADAIERVLLDPSLRRTAGERGRRRVREMFDLEANTRQLASLFWPLIAPPLDTRRS